MKVEQVLKHFGTLTAVAEALDVHYQAVQHWRKNGIPLRRQFELERITKGKLKAERP